MENKVRAKLIVPTFCLTLSEIIKANPRQTEHATAKRFPIVKLLEKSNLLITIITAPKMANPKPQTSVKAWFRFKINFSIKKVMRGARVPRSF